MSTQTIALEGNDIVETRKVGGNLEVDSWDRPDIEARGDSIQIQRGPGSVGISCAGDLILKVPKIVRLNVSTVGGDVRLENLAGAVELHLIGGDATLRNLSGSVRLVGILGGEMHMENVADISMSSGKAGDRFGMAERVRRKVEQAARRAESNVRRAEHRAFQHSRMSGAHHDFGRWDAGAGDASNPSEPAEAVSEEERMTILRMLQEKKITSEQADQLLSALEGKA